MDGRDYINDTIELLERMVAEIETSSVLHENPILGGTKKAIEKLANLKNRATLRTKLGMSLAFPVHDASRAIYETWQEAKEEGDPKGLISKMEDFITAVETLEGALRERTVIMT